MGGGLGASGGGGGDGGDGGVSGSRGGLLDGAAMGAMVRRCMLTQSNPL